jgi:hypothetical protein
VLDVKVKPMLQGKGGDVWEMAGNRVADRSPAAAKISDHPRQDRRQSSQA